MWPLFGRFAGVGGWGALGGTIDILAVDTFAVDILALDTFDTFAVFTIDILAVNILAVGDMRRLGHCRPDDQTLVSNAGPVMPERERKR